MAYGSFILLFYRAKSCCRPIATYKRTQNRVITHSSGRMAGAGCPSSCGPALRPKKGPWVGFASNTGFASQKGTTNPCSWRICDKEGSGVHMATLYPCEILIFQQFWLLKLY